MRSHRLIMVVAAALASAASCNQVAGISRGALRCDDASDCPLEAPVPECRRVACEEGRCTYQDVLEGTPLAVQVAHDCKARVCDGAGDEKEIPAPSDFQIDADPCTEDFCDGSLPKNEKRLKVSCYTGDPAWTEGVGTCRRGIQSCDENGSPVGGCDGQVVPAGEVCDADSRDEDCDGLVNEEGLGCACGDGYLSKGEACDDGNVLDGDACTQSCRFPALSLAAGATSTCAVLGDGSVKCWGTGVPSESGLTDWTNGIPPRASEAPSLPLGTGRKAIAVAMSRSSFPGHACALLDDGQVECWGANDHGQLGVGSGRDLYVGDSWEELGDSLTPVRLGTGERAVRLVLGASHSCALLEGGKIKCWGLNDHGQLGLGNSKSRGLDPAEMGDDLPPVNLGAGRLALDLAAGSHHTCALLDDGHVACWGLASSGQLGPQDSSDRGDEPGEMGDALPYVYFGSDTLTGAELLATALGAGATLSCAALDNGRVECWGDGVGTTQASMGYLDVVDLGKNNTALSIAPGRHHACAVVGGGSPRCWGDNLEGELGLGDTAPHVGSEGMPLPVVDLGSGGSVSALALGDRHTCALLVGGSIKCWGEGALGQLGLGEASNRGDGPNEMGNNLPFVAP